MKFPFVWRGALDEAKGIIRVLELEVDYLNLEIKEMQKDLERAKRNDTKKDPKTGKFTKK